MAICTRYNVSAGMKHLQKNERKERIMKRNIKFFAVVISLLLLSVAILAVCMYAIVTDNGGNEPYDINAEDADPNAMWVSPMGQEAMREKYEQYIHKVGSTATVFTQEQYGKLKDFRESGKRDPLTYEEIIFLINDSISTYFSYYEIRLTNAHADGIGCAPNRINSSSVIYAYHGDFSEYKSYSEANARYKKMLEDIYHIIYYRIYMHDAGFEKVTEALGWDGTVLVYDDGSSFNRMNSIVPRYVMQALSLNGGRSAGQDNKDHLVSEWEKIVENRNSSSSDKVTLTAPLLNVYHDSKGTSLRYQLFITEPQEMRSTRIYPTTELMKKQPKRESWMSFEGIDDKIWDPSFTLYPDEQRFSMNLDSENSFPFVGKYVEEGGVLTLIPDNVELGAAEAYRYVFVYEDDAFVYSSERSSPPASVPAVKDGLKFRRVKDNMYSPYSEKRIATIRDLTIEEGIPTEQAREIFFTDDEYAYIFPSQKSEYVIVTFADGTEMPVCEALGKGYITIRALDVFSIKYTSKEIT